MLKNVTLYALPKSAKHPCSLLQSYHLIALLLYLEKVLKRVVARRLAYLALKYKLFSLIYFSTTPRCSEVDAIAMLAHDIEKTFQDQKILTVLAFDIKKLFVRITDKKPIKRLWNKNISLSIIR